MLFFCQTVLINFILDNLLIDVSLWVYSQRGGAIWAEENEGGKVRGEPSRDFAKVNLVDKRGKIKK